MLQNWTPAQTRSLLKGLAFISPWLVGFAGFVLYPIAASAYY
ncbi:MAG: sugar ABC transporter permease, partial [Caldilineaceae bacterium SB0675_bin_29]|nr:sugar ABC transporter permease [Caldilineaceae bacterium SB0675_bin_29]